MRNSIWMWKSPLDFQNPPLDFLKSPHWIFYNTPLDFQNPPLEFQNPPLDFKIQGGFTLKIPPWILQNTTLDFRKSPLDFWKPTKSRGGFKVQEGILQNPGVDFQNPGGILRNSTFLLKNSVSWLTPKHFTANEIWRYRRMTKKIYIFWNQKFSNSFKSKSGRIFNG